MDEDVKVQLVEFLNYTEQVTDSHWAWGREDKRAFSDNTVSDSVLDRSRVQRNEKFVYPNKPYVVHKRKTKKKLSPEQRRLNTLNRFNEIIRSFDKGRVSFEEALRRLNAVKSKSVRPLQDAINTLDDCRLAKLEQFSVDSMDDGRPINGESI